MYIYIYIHTHLYTRIYTIREVLEVMGIERDDLHSMFKLMDEDG